MANFITGTDNNDSLVGTSSDDVIYGGAGNDSLDGREGADLLDGGAGNDELMSFGRNSTLRGGDGDDRLYAWYGNHLFEGGAGNDVVQDGDGQDTVDGGDGDDSFLLESGNDLIQGGAGADTYYAGRVSYEGDYGRDTLVADARDVVNFADSNDLDLLTVSRNGLSADIGYALDVASPWTPSFNLHVTGTLHFDDVTGLDGLTLVNAWGESKTLAQVLSGENVTYRPIGQLPARDGLQDFMHARVAVGLTGGEGNDTLWSGAGNDTLQGGAGDDALYSGAGNDIVLGGTGRSGVDAGDGDDLIEAEGVGSSVSAGSGRDTIRAQGDIFTGAGADEVQLVGDSRLDFGTDPSTRDEVRTDASFAVQMNWRAGSLATVWREASGQQAAGPITLNDEGNDELYRVQRTPQPGADGGLLPSVSIVSGATGEERIQIVGAADFTQTNPLPYSGVPVNYSTAGYPQPAPIADRSSKLMPVVTAGTQVLKGDALSYLNVIQAIGNAGVVLQGGAGSDWLQGANGDDLLIGGAGDDSMSGGLGADTYLVGRNRGTDTIDADARDTLILAGHRTTDVVVRPWNAANDTVELFLPGEAFYNVDFNIRAMQYSDGHIILRNASKLTDLTIRSEVEGDSTLTWADVAAKAGLQAGVVLPIDNNTGPLGPDSMIGSTGNDTLAGGEGNDTLRGREGDDVLFGGTGDDHLDGGPGNDLLIGGAGSDTLVDGLGNDTLEGRAGSDIYLFPAMVGGERDVLVPDADDIVKFNSAVDLDAIQVQAMMKGVLLSYSDGTSNGELVINDVTGLDGLLFVNAETGDQRTLAQIRSGQALIQEGSDGADAMSGSDLADSLSGMGGDDLLDGGAGNDTLVGGLGNDTLIGGDGNDSLDGSAGDDTLLGGAGNDTLTANFGNDVLDGGAGVNRLSVGSGGAPSADRHTTIRANAQDTLVMANGLTLADAALATYSAQTHTLSLGVRDVASGAAAGQVRIENADQLGALSILGDGGALQTLGDLMVQASQFQVGSLGDDTLLGFEGQDQLEGGTGNDALSGLAGRDTLLGGDGNDLLSAGDGNDVLDGGRGADTLNGGAGQDTFVIRSGDGDDLVYADGEDQVQLAFRRADMRIGRLGTDDHEVLTFTNPSTGGNQSLTFDHASLLKGLTLSFTDGQAGWADVLAEATKPLPPANLTVQGTTGKDTLQGGLGNDTLIGYKGNDTYLFGRGQGQDTIVDKDSSWFNSDALKISNAKSNQLWFTRSGNNLNIAIIGTTDKVTIQDWYTSSANRVEKITALGDNKTLNLSKLNGLVSAMAGFTNQAMAGTDLPAGTSNTLSKLITSSWTPA